MTSKSQQIKNLVKLNDELENYFENTIIPQLFIDANLILRKLTPRAIRQFHFLETDIGKPINQIKNNHYFLPIIENILQVINNNVKIEKQIQTVDAKWYQMNILPYVTIKQNKTNGVIITLVEITQRVKALKDLEQVVNDHEILLDTISHDIKTPLSSLLTAFKIIKDVPPQNVADIQTLLRIQEQSIVKMQSLINKLTATPEQEHKHKAQELIDFEHIVEDVRLTLNDDIIKSGAIIHAEIQVSQIALPSMKLRSIIYNLVANAIKYRLPDRTPEIWIKTEPENDFVIIIVKDNGAGIEKSQQEAIFSKYMSLESKVEGLGIGLYLVKKQVTKAGGRIELHSEPDKGAEFKVYLKAT